MGERNASATDVLSYYSTDLAWIGLPGFPQSTGFAAADADDKSLIRSTKVLSDPQKFYRIHKSFI